MRLKFAGIFVLAFAGAQFLQPIPVNQTHAGPILTGAQAPGHVLRIIERSCGDCHSSNTEWPWYSRIAPLSWVIAHDVERGRGFLNFSQWPNYSRAQKLAFTAAIASATNRDRMPPASYVIMHPEARLSDRDREIVQSWSRAEFRRLAAVRPGRQRTRAVRPPSGS